MVVFADAATVVPTVVSTVVSADKVRVFWQVVVSMDAARLVSMDDLCAVRGHYRGHHRGHHRGHRLGRVFVLLLRFPSACHRGRKWSQLSMP